MYVCVRAYVPACVLRVSLKTLDILCQDEATMRQFYYHKSEVSIKPEQAITGVVAWGRRTPCLTAVQVRALSEMKKPRPTQPMQSVAVLPKRRIDLELSQPSSSVLHGVNTGFVYSVRALCLKSAANSTNYAQRLL